MPSGSGWPPTCTTAWPRSSRYLRTYSRLAARQAPDEPHLYELAESADRALTEARFVIAELARTEDDVRLDRVLADIVAELTERHHREIELDVDEIVVDAHVAYELARIGREAMTNALRHASADRIVVRLGISGSRIELSVTDDGRGCEAPSQERLGSGFGIRSMQERVKRLGGIFTLAPGPRLRGTTVRVAAPLRVTEHRTRALSWTTTPDPRAGTEILASGGFEVVGVGADALEAIALVARHRPDVCILDIHMPGDGIAAARSIASEAPETVVVMLTVATDDDSLFAALRSGAQGYLLKGTDREVMLDMLRSVLRGEPALSPGLAMRILDEFRCGANRRVFVPNRGNVSLTVREAEVLELLRQGLGTAVIARRLFISAVTVRSHIAAVMRKLDANDRDAALKMFDPT